MTDNWGETLLGEHALRDLVDSSVPMPVAGGEIPPLNAVAVQGQPVKHGIGKQSRTSSRQANNI